MSKSTSKPMIRIVELDGTIIDREMDNAEFAEYQIRQAQFEALKIEAQTKAEAKSALLEKLGISEDEAKLLLS